jgi:hypothetical protein
LDDQAKLPIDISDVILYNKVVTADFELICSPLSAASMPEIVMIAFKNSFHRRSGLKSLTPQRGRSWLRLVDHIETLPVSAPEVMAFSLMLRRLRRDAGLGRALYNEPGCAMCAAEILSYYDGTEKELIRFYQKTLDEVVQRISTMRVREHSYELAFGTA